MSSITIQAASKAALTAILVETGVLSLGEGSPKLAPGIDNSHIGGAEIDGIVLSGQYSTININDAIYGIEAAATLKTNLKPYEYTGPAIRLFFGVAPHDYSTTVPFSVTMRQARLALLNLGVLDNVETAIASIADPVIKKAAQITWEFSSEVQRNNGLVTQLAPALGLTSEQIDNLFITAANL
jgi:hypothetical protein